LTRVLDSDAGPVVTGDRQTWQLDDTGPEAYERFLVPRFFRPCAERVLDAAGLIPGARVLDVACGTGVLARAAAERVGPSGAVTGSDLNEGMLRVAESVARDVEPRIRWAVSDVAGMPFGDRAFDVVCCQQGLQFFPDVPAALSEMHRVLAPGGRLVIAMWRPIGHNTIFEPFANALAVHVGASAADIMRGPFAGPPITELRTWLGRAGFAPVTATIESIGVRFPSIDTFIHREVASSPLAGPVGDMEVREREAFLEDVRSRLHPWLDDAGLTFTMETWLLVAGTDTGTDRL
jgi:SAM-dependent methyltransferase